MNITMQNRGKCVSSFLCLVRNSDELYAFFLFQACLILFDRIIREKK